MKKRRRAVLLRAANGCAGVCVREDETGGKDDSAWLFSFCVWQCRVLQTHFYSVKSHETNRPAATWELNC